MTDAENQDVCTGSVKKKLQPIAPNQLLREAHCTLEQLQKYRNIGLEEISKGRVGAIVLAGGQGSRLGASAPKGTYNIGLPSQKSLFQIQAERLRTIERLANEYAKTDGSITWYVMTSDVTNAKTVTFLQDNGFFGISERNLVIFKQGNLPISTDLGSAPDGNGGLYKALNDERILDDMQQRGIRHLHVYSVDNILVKVADPVFIGYCIDNQADCAAKAVRKTDPKEKLGVFCMVDDKISVAEYSEIGADDAHVRGADGELVFNMGNICNHYFSIAFLEDIVNNHVEMLKPHVVRIQTGGFKLEKFIFDAFAASQNFRLWEVPRFKEFSALKNSDEADTDCARTAREDLFRLHKEFIEEAGGVVLNNVEISPLLSYAGENLEDKVKGKTFKTPLYYYLN